VTFLRGGGGGNFFTKGKKTISSWENHTAIWLPVKKKMPESRGLGEGRTPEKILPYVVGGAKKKHIPKGEPVVFLLWGGIWVGQKRETVGGGGGANERGILIRRGGGVVWAVKRGGGGKIIRGGRGGSQLYLRGREIGR